MKKVNIDNFRKPIGKEIEDIFDKGKVHYFYRRDDMQDRITFCIMISFISFFLIKITHSVHYNIWFLLIPIAFLGLGFLFLMLHKKINKEFSNFKKGNFVMKAGHVEKIRKGIKCDKITIYSNQRELFTAKVIKGEFRKDSSVMVVCVCNENASQAKPFVVKL
jgi:hypothetical protein